MANSSDRKFLYPSLLAYIAFAMVYAVAVFLVQGVFEVPLSSLAKAIMFGIAILVFTLTYGRLRTGSES